MNQYKSRSGKPSGVNAYRSGSDFIVVKFVNGDVYTYSYDTAGRKAVETMKQLANAQLGLATYISQINPAYEK